MFARMRGKIFAAVLTGLALAGCSTGAAQPHHGVEPATHQAAAVLPSMSHAESVQDCAALDLVRMGTGSYAREVQTVAGQSGVPQHIAAEMIAKNVRANCPNEVSILP